MKPTLKPSEDVLLYFCLKKIVRKENLIGQKPQLPEHIMGLGVERRRQVLVEGGFKQAFLILMRSGKQNVREIKLTHI